MSINRMINMKFGFRKSTLAMLTGLLALTAYASTPVPPPAEATSSTTFVDGVPGGVIVNTIDVSARVTAIDKANRTATLLRSDGEKITVKIGPEAVNFDQVDVDDWVNLKVIEEIVIYLNEEGESQSNESAGLVASAPKGAQPGGVVAETTQITGIVTAIDPKNRTATLQFEDGTTKTFPVRSDIDLTKRKVGEQVVFRVTEMIAISVEKP